MKHRLSVEQANELKAILSQVTGASQRRASTFDALVAAWADFVRNVEQGYQYSIYDYTDDLAYRDFVARAERAASDGLREELQRAIAPIDARFEAATRAVLRPLLEDCRESGWWWWRIPKKLEGELKADLDSEGFSG